MTFVCNILYYSMFENVSNCNIMTPKRVRHDLRNLKFLPVLKMI